jgi:hypothetical protein
MSGFQTKRLPSRPRVWKPRAPLDGSKREVHPVFGDDVGRSQNDAPWPGVVVASRVVDGDEPSADGDLLA